MHGVDAAQNLASQAKRDPKRRPRLKAIFFLEFSGNNWKWSSI